MNNENQQADRLERRVSWRLSVGIAENAAREYEQQTLNGYFDTRPEELHKVLVRIISGTHILIKEAEIDLAQ